MSHQVRFTAVSASDHPGLGLGRQVRSGEEVKVRLAGESVGRRRRMEGEFLLRFALVLSLSCMII